MAAPSGWGELCSKFGENGDFATDLPEIDRIIARTIHISCYRVISPDIPRAILQEAHNICKKPDGL